MVVANNRKTQYGARRGPDGDPDAEEDRNHYAGTNEGVFMSPSIGSTIAHSAADLARAKTPKSNDPLASESTFMTLLVSQLQNQDPLEPDRQHGVRLRSSLRTASWSS